MSDQVCKHCGGLPQTEMGKTIQKILKSDAFLAKGKVGMALIRKLMFSKHVLRAIDELMEDPIFREALQQQLTERGGK